MSEITAEARYVFSLLSRILTRILSEPTFPELSLLLKLSFTYLCLPYSLTFLGLICSSICKLLVNKAILHWIDLLNSSLSRRSFIFFLPFFFLLILLLLLLINSQAKTGTTDLELLISVCQFVYREEFDEYYFPTLKADYGNFRLRVLLQWCRETVLQIISSLSVSWVLWVVYNMKIQ